MFETLSTPGRIARLRHVVLDMDGTIYLDQQLFAETKPFLQTLLDNGIGYSFITNNNSLSRAEYLIKLERMGLPTPAESLVTSAHAAAAYLKTHLPAVRRPFVLGTPGLVEDLGLAGYAHEETEPDAVVVGFDRTLDYEKLCRTAYWVKSGLPYLATHPDRVCPTKDATVLPDCAAICALIESATGRAPDAVPGKPSPAMLEGLADQLSLPLDQLAMVGDRLYTDIRMAVTAGAIGVLTLTGEATEADLVGSEVRPDLVIKDLGDFARQIVAARQPAS